MSEKVKFKHALGAKVRDSVTGYEGTITGSFVFINGCIRYSVEAPGKEAGALPTDMTVDEDRLEPVKAERAKVERKPTGGPRPTPARSAEPKR